MTEPTTNIIGMPNNNDPAGYHHSNNPLPSIYGKDDFFGAPLMNHRTSHFEDEYAMHMSQAANASARDDAAKRGGHNYRPVPQIVTKQMSASEKFGHYDARSPSVTSPFTATPYSASSFKFQSPIEELDSPSQAGVSRRDRRIAHTPRPPNSFILYRREKHIEITSQYKGGKALNNSVISKIVANMWREEKPEIKARFAQKADEEKHAHMLKYPDYKYKPRKSIKNLGKNNANDPKLMGSIPRSVLPLYSTGGRASMSEDPYQNMSAYPFQYPDQQGYFSVVPAQMEQYAGMPFSAYEERNHFPAQQGLPPSFYGQMTSSMFENAGLLDIGLEHKPSEEALSTVGYVSERREWTP
jgi:HMG (high mobility group) box